MFSLESPRRGDSNEYAQYPFSIYKKKITLNDLKSVVMGFSQGLKNEFETAVVNEPSVFEPLKFCCICNNVAANANSLPDFPAIRAGSFLSKLSLF